jgi:MOSC domain-containing protein YiiM
VGEGVPTWNASPPRSPSAPQGPAWGWRRARSLAGELRVAGRLVLVGVIVSVNVGTPREISWRGQTVRTAIWKDPVPGRVGVRGTSVDGDEQGNPEAHGGYDKALYAYAAEDYRWWGGELGRDLGPGTFGENLTVRGIDVSGAVVGERWRAGGTLLEVSSPRTPCYKLGYRMGDQGFVRRFAGAGRPGAYLRILAEGEVAAGDPVEVVHRPAHGLTVAEVSRIYHHDHAAADRLLGVPELAGTWKDWAEKFATSAGRS